MPLAPQVKVLTSQQSGILVQDATGNYDANSNPGGWGGPNPISGAVLRLNIAAVPLSSVPDGGTNLGVTDQNNYLQGGGYAILPATTPGFLDGVFDIRVRYAFSTGQPVSAVAGSLQFTMTNASSIFAPGGMIGFSIDSLDSTLIYFIDRTKPLTTTGGWVTTALPGVSGAAATGYVEGQTYALQYQQGQACLQQDIAHYSQREDSSQDDELNNLILRYEQEMSIFTRFAGADWAGADAIARKLMADCRGGACDPLIPVPVPGSAGVAPVITIQPVGLTQAAGTNGTLSVSAIGTPLLRYQWKKNGVDIPGAIDPTLLLLNLSNSSNASYSVVIYNDYGYVESTNVLIAIAAAQAGVVITQQPVSVTTNQGNNVTFNVAATGTAPLQYQWQKNGSNMVGQNSPSLTLLNVTNSDAAAYTVLVSNSVNSVLSNVATLAIAKLAQWGWAATQPVTQADINNLQLSGPFTAGGPVVADYRTNTSPLYLIMSEPASEPVKVKWFVNANNNGNIGNINNDLFIFVIIGTSRVYYTVFPTVQTDAPVQFLTS